MMQKAAFYKTVAELAAAGPERIPAELISIKHVIYNSRILLRVVICRRFPGPLERFVRVRKKSRQSSWSV